jgi:hypothetical protein
MVVIATALPPCSGRTGRGYRVEYHIAAAVHMNCRTTWRTAVVARTGGEQAGLAAHTGRQLFVNRLEWMWLSLRYCLARPTESCRGCPTATTVAGNKARGIQAMGRVALLLQHGRASQRLSCRSNRGDR